MEGTLDLERARHGTAPAEHAGVVVTGSKENVTHIEPDVQTVLQCESADDRLAIVAGRVFYPGVHRSNEQSSAMVFKWHVLAVTQPLAARQLGRVASRPEEVPRRFRTGILVLVP